MTRFSISQNDINTHIVAYDINKWTAGFQVTTKTDIRVPLELNEMCYECGPPSRRLVIKGHS